MKLKNERGAVMVESIYCLLLAIFVLIFFLSFGFFLYQKTIVTIIANEVAEDVSQTYKLRNVNDASTITVDDIEGIGKYRYLLFSNNFNSKNKQKAKNATKNRLTQTALAENKGDLSIDIKPIVDDIGRRHYKINVKQKYSFLLGGILKVIGQEDTQIVESTVYVESMDVLNYINTVKTTQYGLEKTKELDIVDMLDTVISLINKIVG